VGARILGQGCELPIVGLEFDHGLGARMVGMALSLLYMMLRRVLEMLAVMARGDISKNVEILVLRHEIAVLVGANTCPMACDLRLHRSGQATRWYWLITPPRTRLRRTGASIATTTSGSWLGGR